MKQSAWTAQVGAIKQNCKSLTKSYLFPSIFPVTGRLTGASIA
jgi:hypothetical protein